MAITVIKRNGDAGPMWFSIKEGRNQGAPQGGWSSNKALALQFGRPVDATEFTQAFLPQVASTCEFEPYDNHG